MGERAALSQRQDPGHGRQLRDSLGEQVDAVRLELRIRRAEHPAGQSWVQCAQARADGLAEELVLDARALVCVQREPIDHPAVEQERGLPRTRSWE